MKTKITGSLLLKFILVTILVLAVNGCSPEQLLPEELVVEENDDVPVQVEDADPVLEEPLNRLPYYWPWISYGHLDLSSGEIILGPDLFESDLGFIAEFTEDYSFDGLVVWPVQESDVFELEWVKLSFNVEYYDHDELLFDLYYEFVMEDLQPEPGNEGYQEFPVSLVEQQQGFEVLVKKVLLGKEQQSAYSDNLINYVALEIEMRVVDNP